MLQKRSFLPVAAGLIIIGLCSYYALYVLEMRTGRGQVKINHGLKLEDAYHRVVAVDTIPSRVISVAPNITEIIFALGEGKRLVGRTDYCDYPAEAASIESIGNITEPNMEKIVSLNPDIVIASTHFQKETLDKLEDLGIKVAILKGEESFDGLYHLICQVGQVLHSDRKATELVSDLQKRVADIVLKVQKAPKLKVFYLIFYGDSGFYTAGQDTFIGNMIAMAGGDNVAADSKGWQYSIEKLVEKDPDILICSKFYHAKEVLEKTPGFKDMRAVKDGKLLEIDHNLLDRQGPRLVEGLETLARLLHPEIFGVGQGGYLDYDL